MKYANLLATVCFLLVSFILAPGAQACTGMRIVAKDGSVVFVRSMEFGTSTHSDIMIAPQGMTWQSGAPNGKSGLKWTSKYTFMGPDGFDAQVPLEGINEKGLYAGGFWMPKGESEFPKVNPSDYPQVVSQFHFVAWILGNCATVDEVKAALPKLKLTGITVQPWGIYPWAHWCIMDSTGKSIAVEYLNGKLEVTDNPVGVFTNAPSFRWHLTNLRNYINLSPKNATPVKLGDLKVKPLGEGTGLLGIPGDITPPSRFVKAAIYANAAYKTANADEVVNLGMNLIASFAIPKGVAREVGPSGKPESDYTQWTTVYDFSRKTMYFRTYENQDYCKVRMDAVKFKDARPMFVPMWTSKPAYKDVTNQAKPAK